MNDTPANNQPFSGPRNGADLTPDKEALLQQIHVAATAEHADRLAKGELWAGLTFSRSRILEEVVGQANTPWSQAIAVAMLRQAHRRLLGLPAQLSEDEAQLRQGRRHRYLLSDKGGAAACGNLESGF